MMEAVSTSEMPVNFYQTTRRNIPEDSHLYISSLENLNASLVLQYHDVFTSGSSRPTETPDDCEERPEDFCIPSAGDLHVRHIFPNALFAILHTPLALMSIYCRYKIYYYR
jgi:hypothetical protein